MVELGFDEQLNRNRYRDRLDIKKVVIRGEKGIPDYCFMGCSNLETVVLDEEVSRIGISAFENCVSLKNVIIEGGGDKNSYITVCSRAFKGCVNLEDNGFISMITDFWPHCFQGCYNLHSIQLGARIRSIEASAFSGSRIKDYKISKANKKYYINDGFLIERVEKKYFKALIYFGRSEKCVIPKEITMLSNMCFKDRLPAEQISEVWLPSGLTSLDDNECNDDIFYMPEIICDEPDAYIQDKLSMQVSDVFDGCHSLKAFHVSKSNPVYSTIKGALYSKDHKELVKVPPAHDGEFIVPKGVMTISDRAFAGCKKCFSIVFNETIEMIGFAAFADSSIYSIACPEEGKVFKKDNGLYMRDEGPGKGEGSLELLFYDRLAKHVKLIDAPLTIREYAFQNCNQLKDVDLIYAVNGAKIPCLMEYAFKGCSALRSVVLPNGVKCVPSGCFEDCTSLKKIEFSEDINVVCDDFISGCLKDITIVINTKRKRIYADDHPFRGYDGHITFEIRSDIFNAEGYSDLLNEAPHCRYTVSGDAKKRYAAYEGFLLEKVEGQDMKLLHAPSDTSTFASNFEGISIVEVSSNAFSGCENLKYVYFSDALKYYSQDTLEYCRKVQFIRVPGNLIVKFKEYERDGEKERLDKVNIQGFTRIHSDIKSLSYVQMGKTMMPIG